MDYEKMIKQEYDEITKTRIPKKEGQLKTEQAD